MTIRTGYRLPANLWRTVGWGPEAAILLIPLLAMRFTQEVNWTHGDFAAAAVLLWGTGLLVELGRRATTNRAARAMIAAGLIAALLLVWAEPAVGIVN